MTTGSIVQGTVKGLRMGLGTSGLVVNDTILFVNGTPLNKVTCQVGSDIAFDVNNSLFYMGLGIGGSTWVKLGSIA